MPRIKAFSTYPTEYSMALRRVVGGSVLELEFSSPTSAASWRGQFYAFLGACRREGALPNASEELQDLARLSAQVMLVLRSAPDGTARVVLQHRDRSWQAEVLRNAKELQVAPVIEPPNALRKLLSAEPPASTSPYPKSED